MRALICLVMSAASLVASAQAPNASPKTRSAVDVRLSCPAQHFSLDRGDIKGTAYEEIAIKAKPLDFGKDAKTGKPQTAWMTEAKITSNKQVFEGSLLANGPEYAVIAYADLQRGGISGSVQTVVYQIDLATLKLKRSITFFPAGKDAVTEGVCKKL